jgi:hypothetical protein
MITRKSVQFAVVGAIALAAVTAGAAAAQDKVVRPRAGVAGEWRLLGQVTANFKADHDTIVVRGPYDNFRRIKFKVTDAPLNIQRRVVTYDNGEPDRLDVRQRIEKGGGRADVTLFGLK